MQTNSQLDLAFDFLQHTGTHLFLTGKAGTGKTTFLKQLKEMSPKRMIVVAPTGVAAINAGGVTIHSFFQLPFGPYLPDRETADRRSGKSFSHKFSRDKINLIRSMDLLVIDEISMVRADLLDAISDVLRRYKDRTKPFGGVQLLLIGDLQQLAPVAKEEEWNLLKEYYSSAFFFDSKALKESRYLCIELTQVYRQDDDRFVGLLNRIRENCLDEETLQALNRRYIPNFAPDDQAGYITLTTHNYLAQQINKRKLDELPGRSYAFSAEIKDDFPAYSYPTDERLALKLGAQVMFVKNDSSGERRYYNGKIGRVVFIGSERIVVSDKEGNEIDVNRETWANVKYTLDPDTKEITEALAGTFSQYPLKTAWAITIHKSQGLTFEHAVIDASAAFSHGQVYVALSRCKSLEGLVLSRPITTNALVKDEQICQYTEALYQKYPGVNELQEAEQRYFQELAVELVDFSSIQQRLQYAAYVVYSHLQRLYPELSNRYAFTRDNFRSDVTEVGERFKQQLTRMITGNVRCLTDPAIQERIRKGSSYFLEQIEKYGRPLLQASGVEIDNKEARKVVTQAIDHLATELTVKQATLEACREGFSIVAYLSAKAKASIEPIASTKKKNVDRSSSRNRKTSRKEGAANEEVNGFTGPGSNSFASPAGAAASIGTENGSGTEDVKHPDLYAVLKKWRYEHAAEKGLPAYTILQQKALIGLSNTLPRNQRELLAVPGIGKKIMENYGDELLTILEKYRESGSAEFS